MGQTKRWLFLTYPTFVWGLLWKFADILASEDWTPLEPIVTCCLRDRMFRGVVTVPAYDGQTDTR